MCLHTGLVAKYPRKRRGKSNFQQNITFNYKLQTVGNLSVWKQFVTGVHFVVALFPLFIKNIFLRWIVAYLYVIQAFYCGRMLLFYRRYFTVLDAILVTTASFSSRETEVKRIASFPLKLLYTLPSIICQ